MRLGLDEVFIHWVSTLGICLCFHTAAIYAGCWMQYTYLQGGSSALWEYLPSLDKSTYGFCGHKYPPDIARCVDRRQPACRSALPRTPFLPRKNSEKRVCPCQAKVKSPVQTHAGGQGNFFILRFPRWNLTPAVRCLPPPPGGSPRPPR